MKLEEFIKRESVLDLSFFNFSNAITAAYFASNELEVLRVNNNFKRFFPVLENVTNVLFTSVLEQLGVESHLIDEFESGLKKDGKVLIPRIELNIEGFWSGNRTEYQNNFTVRPFPGINLNLGYIHSKVNLNEGNFKTNLIRFLGGFDLSPFISFSSNIL